MNTHLPADLEQFVQAKVRSGRFASPDEAITAAVRLLRSRKKPRWPASWRASARAWRTCGPVAGGRRRRCSLTSAVSSTFPRTHDLPHCRRAYGRAGDSVRRSLEDRKRFPRRRGTVVQRPGQENRHAPPPSDPLSTGRRKRQVPRGNPRVALRQERQADTQAPNSLHRPRGHRPHPFMSVTPPATN